MCTLHHCLTIDWLIPLLLQFIGHTILFWPNSGGSFYLARNLWNFSTHYLYLIPFSDYCLTYSTSHTNCRAHTNLDTYRTYCLVICGTFFTHYLHLISLSDHCLICSTCMKIYTTHSTSLTYYWFFDLLLISYFLILLLNKRLFDCRYCCD